MRSPHPIDERAEVKARRVMEPFNARQLEFGARQADGAVSGRAIAAELVPRAAAAAPSPSELDPAVVYLARLDVGSRKAIESSLRIVAGLLTGAAGSPFGFPWQKLRYEHTGALRALLVERYAPASTNRHLAALRGVLKEAWRLGLMSAEDRARASDVASVSATTLPAGRELWASELRALFEGCTAGSVPAILGARDAALLTLLFGAGLRRAEAVGVDLADFNRETGEVKVREGKRRKQRLVYLGATGRAAVDAWLEYRALKPGPLLRPVRKGGALGKGRLAADSVYRIVHAAGIRSSLPAFSPHDLRRTFVSALLEEGADISVVQQLAGHASVSTTIRYDRRGERAKKKAAELLHVPYVG